MRKRQRFPAVKTYQAVENCVDVAIEYGYRRAHKHVEAPDGDHIKEQIRQAIMNELCEWFFFDEE